MIWRHMMFAVSNVDYVLTNVVDRVGRIARGLQAVAGRERPRGFIGSVLCVPILM